MGRSTDWRSCGRRSQSQERWLESRDGRRRWPRPGALSRPRKGAVRAGEDGGEAPDGGSVGFAGCAFRLQVRVIELPGEGSAFFPGAPMDWGTVLPLILPK